MPQFIEVPGANELAGGQMNMFMVGGREILLARVDAAFYAADNRCPHMGGILSDGQLEQTIITCPRHHSRFDLKDGRVLRWTDWSGLKLTFAKIARAPRPLKTYAVKFEDNKVFVDI